jgi:hypothetical protein
MAKRVRNTRPAAATRKAKGSRRITTRRVAAPGTRSPMRTTLARGRGTRARQATLQVTLELRDVTNRLIRDPETYFTFRRVSDRRQIGDQIAMEVTGAPNVFNLPAATGELLVCEIDPQRFRFAHSPVFFQSPGPAITKVVSLLREPEAWTPRFTRWSTLPAGFADLKRVLSASPNVTLFKEVEPLADLLVDSAYDRMTGGPVAQAKTAFLNAHYRLNTAREPVSGTRTWFSFVSRLVAIGQERFLAFVDPEMETLVRQVHTHIEEFRADYERTPAENHRRNVPPALQSRITNMISIKSSHSKGNFQLTLTHLSGPDEVLLDADIDESGELLAHCVDLFKHKITGGTHPHDIHDLLALQDGALPGFDLGYRLV